MSKLNIKSFFGDRSFYKEVTGIALPIMAQQFVTSFVISVEDGSLLVEVGGYDSMPKQVGYQLEEALGTFALSN